MVAQFTDTIIALATGAPPTAVAMIRLSGPHAYQIASTVFSKWPSEPTPRTAIYGVFSHGDDGLALPFPAGQSYTGDETVEFSIHGSAGSINGLLAACQSAGARLAKPGEFTQRAFLNGRLDLAQAEAVRDITESETESQLRAAQANLRGQLTSQIAALRHEIVGILAEVEARIDFSEELGELDHSSISTRARLLASEANQILERSRASRISRQGLRVAIIGPPNAGKSSLLNALLGADRAIVTEVAGTTRDTIEETLDLDGLRVVLIDTAGLRESTDPVESIGIQRSRLASENADEVWYVFDGSVGLTEIDEQTVASIQRPLRLISNKSDRSYRSYKSYETYRISALTGEGLPELRASLKADHLQTGPRPYLNDRLDPVIAQVAQELEALEREAASLAPPDLLAVILQETLAQLGLITGETASADLLNEIFSRFCIGK